MRRTKIVATVGPASSDPAMLARLVAAGVDVFRLNYSHADRATHDRTLHHIRAAAEEARRAIGILQDLGGPKIRTGDLESGAELRLEAGDEMLMTREPGPVRLASCSLIALVSESSRT